MNILDWIPFALTAEPSNDFSFQSPHYKGVAVIVDKNLQKSFDVLCSESKPRPVPPEFGPTTIVLLKLPPVLSENENATFIIRQSCYVDSPC